MSEDIRFYVDESLMALARALPIVRPDTTAVNHPRGAHGIVAGTLDPDWMPIIGAHGWIVICRDRKLKTRPDEKALMIKHKIKVIRVGSRRDMNSWAYLRLLTMKWDLVENQIATAPDGPWFLNVGTHHTRLFEVS